MWFYQVIFVTVPTDNTVKPEVKNWKKKCMDFGKKIKKNKWVKYITVVPIIIGVPKFLHKIFGIINS